MKPSAFFFFFFSVFDGRCRPLVTVVVRTTWQKKKTVLVFSRNGVAWGAAVRGCEQGKLFGNRALLNLLIVLIGDRTDGSPTVDRRLKPGGCCQEAAVRRA